MGEWTGAQMALVRVDGCAEGCGGLEKSRVDGWIIWVG